MNTWENCWSLIHLSVWQERMENQRQREFWDNVLPELLPTGYLIGDGHGHMPEDAKYFVLESCEFQRHFLAYHPDYALITNIELDHVDYYKRYWMIISMRFNLLSIRQRSTVSFLEMIHICQNYRIRYLLRHMVYKREMIIRL